MLGAAKNLNTHRTVTVHEPIYIYICEVILKVLVKKGPLGIHILKEEILSQREPMLWPFWGQVS